MTCNPTSAREHGYIIIAIDYFTKWVETMPTLNNSGETTALFFFNHVVAQFGVPKAIVIDHGSHFRNHMVAELAAKLGLSHDSSTPYYPQANGQVEAINKVLKQMLRSTFLELIHLDETRHDAALANEAHKKFIKEQYDRNVKPHIFLEGDLVLLYDREADKLGAGKFEPMWMGPYVVKRVLEKAACALVDYDGIPLLQPQNGLYLKRYYA
eukprot:PITA_01890